MIALCLLLGGMRGGRNIQLSRRPRMQLIPPLNLLRRPRRKTLQYQELFEERKASR